MLKVNGVISHLCINLTLEALGTVKPVPRPRKLRLRINVRPISGGISNPNVIQNYSSIPKPAMTTDISKAQVSPIKHTLPQFTPVVYRTGRFGAGQGKAVSKIIADQGNIMTIITDVPYVERSKPRVWEDRPPKGSRPMHTSNLLIPTQKYTDYDTTSMRFFCGNRSHEPRDLTKPKSQHLSQITIDHKGQEAELPMDSHYHVSFWRKPSDTPARIRKLTLDNRLRMDDASELRSIMAADAPAHQHVTQYNRVHGKLGVMLGTGVMKESPPRRTFDVLTGQEIENERQPDIRRISANRLLYKNRRDTGYFILG